MSAEELLRRPAAAWADLQRPWQASQRSQCDAAEQIEIDVKYAGYVARAQRRAEAARKMECGPAPRGHRLDGR